MSSKRLLLQAATLSVALATLAAWLAGCNRSDAAAPPPPPAVTVSKPLHREVIEWDEYIGRLEATEVVDLRARVSGLVESVHFTDGQVVEKGQLLFKLDPRPFQAEYDRAKGDVVKNEAQLRFATADLESVEKTRLTGAVSGLEFETKRQAKGQAEGTLASAKAAAEAARLNLDFTEVRAPIDGLIDNRAVTPGNLVNGGSGQATRLATIARQDPMYCYVDADEASVLKYQRLAAEKKRASARDGRIPCFMNLSDETGFKREGIIDFLDNHINPATGTLKARGVFPNTDHRLFPGYFARLRVVGSGRYKAILVPDASIGTDQGQKFVYVVVNGEVEYRKVKLGASFEKLRAIEEGVGPDDLVIVNGTQRAKPGAKVTATLAQIPQDAYKLTAPNSATTQALPETHTRNLPATAPTSAPAAGEPRPAPSPDASKDSTPVEPK